MDTLLFVGILISLLFTELTGLSPGGIIVPAYFAAYFPDTRRMAATVALSFLCLVAVRLLSSHMILYGRRRSGMYLLCGMLLKYLSGYFARFPFAGNLAFAIGFLVPGLLAKDMERQGIPLTLLSLAAATCLARLVYLVL